MRNKLAYLHSYFDGKISQECYKFLKALMRINKLSTDKKGFQNITHLVDSEFFFHKTLSDKNHHRLSVDEFKFLDFENLDKSDIFVSDFHILKH